MFNANLIFLLLFFCSLILEPTFPNSSRSCSKLYLLNSISKCETSNITIDTCIIDPIHQSNFPNLRVSTFLPSRLTPPHTHTSHTPHLHPTLLSSHASIPKNLDSELPYPSFPTSFPNPHIYNHPKSAPSLSPPDRLIADYSGVFRGLDRLPHSIGLDGAFRLDNQSFFFKSVAAGGGLPLFLMAPRRGTLKLALHHLREFY